MSDCTFKAKIMITPSSHEFWPAGGWSRTKAGWQRFYSCCDRHIVRRALVSFTGGCWTFAVSEITRFGKIAVALQPAFEHPTQPTECIHAADLAACGHRYAEVGQ